MRHEPTRTASKACGLKHEPYTACLRPQGGVQRPWGQAAPTGSLLASRARSIEMNAQPDDVVRAKYRQPSNVPRLPAQGDPRKIHMRQAKMRQGQLIGYARVDAEADSGALAAWVRQLCASGAVPVFTDVGSLPTALAGLRHAIGFLQVNDTLIYPEVCLRELTVADIPTVFAHIPDGTALKFFQPCAPNGYASGDDMTSIRLIKAECENADG